MNERDDDVLKWAREAGFTEFTEDGETTEWTGTHADMQRFAVLAHAAGQEVMQREAMHACQELMEAHYDGLDPGAYRCFCLIRDLFVPIDKGTE